MATPENSKGEKYIRQSENANGSPLEPLWGSSLINNRMVAVPQAPGVFKAGSNGWDWSMGSIQDPS